MGARLFVICSSSPPALLSKPSGEPVGRLTSEHVMKGSLGTENEQGGGGREQRNDSPREHEQQEDFRVIFLSFFRYLASEGNPSAVALLGPENELTNSENSWTIRRESLG